MSIKEIWLTSLSLYRKSLPQIWRLGIVAGITVTTSLFINAFYKTDGTTSKIISVVVPLTISLSFVYLSSMILLKIYNISNGQSISWKDTISFINKRYIKVTVSMLIVFIINILGTIALLLPGIFAFVLFSMTQPLALLDNKGIMESVKGSYTLVWGKWWHTFAAIVPLIFINYWIDFSISYATTHAQWYIVICSALIAMLFYPLLYSCVLVIFKDLKSRMD